jgi:hypothetical protein
MFARTMLYQLVFSVILYFAELASIGLIISVPPLMIFTVTYRREFFLAKIALVWFFPSVCSHMYQKVAFFGKYFSTTVLGTFEQIVATVSAFDMQI